MSNNAIEVDGLTKQFGSFNAINNVSFSVHTGEIFGILGPNGAGKTTTLEIIEGLQAPTKGHTKVLDINSQNNAPKVKERIGVQLQSSAYFDYLTLTEILDLFGQFYPKRIPAKTLLAQVGLSDQSSLTPRKLSGGQRQRFTVAATLVNDPEIVILDEPSTGLDPQSRRNLWTLIRQFNNQGRTVVLTTHYMEEAEELCDRVAIMNTGNIIALDTPDNLVHSLPTPYTIKLVSHSLLPVEEIQELGWTHLTTADTDNHTYTFKSKESPQTLSWLLEWAATRQLIFKDIQIIKASLEDVFLAFTGHQLKD